VPAVDLQAVLTTLLGCLSRQLGCAEQTACQRAPMAGRERAGAAASVEIIVICGVYLPVAACCELCTADLYGMHVLRPLTKGSKCKHWPRPASRQCKKWHRHARQSERPSAAANAGLQPANRHSWQRCKGAASVDRNSLQQQQQSRFCSGGNFWAWRPLCVPASRSNASPLLKEPSQKVCVGSSDTRQAWKQGHGNVLSSHALMQASFHHPAVQPMRPQLTSWWMRCEKQSAPT
jgi:hypothetical protein